MIDTIPRYFSSFSKFILFLFIFLPSQVGAREYNYETDESISPKGLINFNKEAKISHLICLREKEFRGGDKDPSSLPFDIFFSNKDGSLYSNKLEKSLIKANNPAIEELKHESGRIDRETVYSILSKDELILNVKLENIEDGKLIGNSKVRLIYDLNNFDVTLEDLKNDSQKNYLFAKCKKVKPFPFKLNPNEFTKYLSTKLKKETYRTTAFKDLDNCNLIGKEYKRAYVCKYGFITSRDRMGEQICRLSYVKYIKATGKHDFQISEDKNDCRLKQ